MDIANPDLFQFLVDNYLGLLSVIILLVAFFNNYALIPKVIWVVHQKKLYKEVNGRSAHNDQTSTLAGVAFFITFVLILSILQGGYNSAVGNNVIAAITLVFMVGVKDDLVVSSAKTKFIGQVVAALFVVLSSSTRIENLHGFLGLTVLPPFVGAAISVFILLAIINAYNLIDGVNGLAAIIGIVICSTFAWSFYVMNAIFFLMISLVTIGILFGFLPHNFAKGDRRIFMGDSGSLMIGLIIGMLTLRVITLTEHPSLMRFALAPDHRILFALSVLFIPTFDTLRVMVLRLSKGKSPFSADANHTHHILLRAGFCHWQVSLLLGIINLGVIVLYMNLGFFFSSTVVLFVGVILCYLILYYVCYRLSLKYPETEASLVPKAEGSKAKSLTQKA